MILHPFLFILIPVIIFRFFYFGPHFLIWYFGGSRQTRSQYFLIEREERERERDLWFSKLIWELIPNSFCNAVSAAHGNYLNRIEANSNKSLAIFIAHEFIRCVLLVQKENYFKCRYKIWRETINETTNLEAGNFLTVDEAYTFVEKFLSHKRTSVSMSIILPFNFSA